MSLLSSSLLHHNVCIPHCMQLEVSKPEWQGGVKEQVGHQPVRVTSQGASWCSCGKPGRLKHISQKQSQELRSAGKMLPSLLCSFTQTSRPLWTINLFACFLSVPVEHFFSGLQDNTCTFEVCLCPVVPSWRCTDQERTAFHIANHAYAAPACYSNSCQGKLCSVTSVKWSYITNFCIHYNLLW